MSDRDRADGADLHRRAAAQYAPLVEDELLYIANTESDVVREVNTQLLYVLISGRWFRAPSPDGPWTFVRGDELPASFRRVPPDSPKGNILASVAGTDQADDAIADAEIPQTSAIRRDDYELRGRSTTAIRSSSRSRAPICSTPSTPTPRSSWRTAATTRAIRASGTSRTIPDGPWRVSETRPLGVDDIPPSCPVYDVRYVYIYDCDAGRGLRRVPSGLPRLLPVLRHGRLRDRLSVPSVAGPAPFLFPAGSRGASRRATTRG